MAEAHYVVTSSVAPSAVWSFCEDPSNWVDLIPGYCSHEAIDDRRSAWKVQVDLGPFSRVVDAEVTIAEVVTLERVKFLIQGSPSTPFAGEGEIRAAADSDLTTIHLDISLIPSGPMGPVVDAIAGPVLPNVAEDFVTELMTKIDQKFDPVSAAVPAVQRVRTANAALTPRSLAFLSRLIQRLLGRRGTGNAN